MIQKLEIRGLIQSERSSAGASSRLQHEIAAFPYVLFFPTIPFLVGMFLESVGFLFLPGSTYGKHAHAMFFFPFFPYILWTGRRSKAGRPAFFISSSVSS